MTMEEAQRLLKKSGSEGGVLLINMYPAKDNAQLQRMRKTLLAEGGYTSIQQAKLVEKVLDARKNPALIW